jgi:hypothetical protein
MEGLEGLPLDNASKHRTWIIIATKLSLHRFSSHVLLCGKSLQFCHLPQSPSLPSLIMYSKRLKRKDLVWITKTWMESKTWYLLYVASMFIKFTMGFFFSHVFYRVSQFWVRTQYMLYVLWQGGNKWIIVWVY